MVGCHQHPWDLQASYYPWLTDRIGKRVYGEHAAIRRNHLLEDFLRDAAGVNLVQSVHVQAEHDHGDPVWEMRWLQAIADLPDSGGFPHGIVACADFALPDVGAILEARCGCRKVRRIRQMLREGLVNPKTRSHLHVCTQGDSQRRALVPDLVARLHADYVRTVRRNVTAHRRSGRVAPVGGLAVQAGSELDLIRRHDVIGGGHGHGEPPIIRRVGRRLA
jgi:predicted TIM-barrel fold metal-dependent hydrolase